MVTVDDDLVNNLAHHDSNITVTELVRYLERHHPTEGAGVPRELVDAYADELGYDRDRVTQSLDDRLTDARTWQPGGRLYRVGDNVSIYPPSWHEQLAGSTDLRRYVEVMIESVHTPPGVEIDDGDFGVATDELVTAVEIFADVDRSRARQLMRQQRREGTIVQYAFQNPEEVVRLPDERAE